MHIFYFWLYIKHLVHRVLRVDTAFTVTITLIALKFIMVTAFTITITIVVIVIVVSCPSSTSSCRKEWVVV